VAEDDTQSAAPLSSWSTPTLTEVPHNSAEFWGILAALSPEERALVKSPKISAGLSGGGGLGVDPHRYRWLDIDAGGRPPRDRTNDENLCDELVAALVAAPSGDLRGEYERPSRKRCVHYLEERFSGAPRRVVRAAIKSYFGR
jgi:hypothetical protein